MMSDALSQTSRWSAVTPPCVCVQCNAGNSVTEKQDFNNGESFKASLSKKERILGGKLCPASLFAQHTRPYARSERENSPTAHVTT